MKRCLVLRDCASDSGTSTERWSLRRAFVLNLVGLAVPGLTALAVIPPTLAAIGAQQFGVVALVWGGLVVAGVLDLGVGRALTQKIASLSGGDASLHADWVRAALVGAFAFSLLLLTLGFVFIATFALFGLISQAVSDAIANSRAVILLLALVMPVHAMMVSVRGYYEGLGLFAEANAQRIVVNVSTLVLPLVSYSLGGGLEEAIVGMLIVRMGAVAALLLVIRDIASVRDGGDVRSRVRELLKFGSIYSIESIIKGFASQADRYLIAVVGGASMVAVFSVPADLVFQALVPLGALTTALFPRFVSEGQCSAAFNRLMRWSALVFVVSSAFALPMYWQIENILGVWLQEPLDGMSDVARALIVGLPLYSVASVATAHLHAARRLRATLGVSLVSVFFSVPLMYLLYSYGGVVGMAWYWPAKYLFEAFALLLLSRSRGV